MSHSLAFFCCCCFCLFVCLYDLNLARLSLRISPKICPIPFSLIYCSIFITPVRLIIGTLCIAQFSPNLTRVLPRIFVRVHENEHLAIWSQITLCKGRLRVDPLNDYSCILFNGKTVWLSTDVTVNIQPMVKTACIILVFLHTHKFVVIAFLASQSWLWRTYRRRN